MILRRRFIYWCYEISWY